LGRGFNSRRLHHFEDGSEKSFVLRTAMTVSANESKGFFKGNGQGLSA